MTHEKQRRGLGYQAVQTQQEGVYIRQDNGRGAREAALFGFGN